MTGLVCRTHGYAAEGHAGDPLFCLWVPSGSSRLVTVALRYQVECAACGPLEAGDHASLPDAMRDRDEHEQSHLAGHYPGGQP